MISDVEQHKVLVLNPKSDLRKFYVTFGSGTLFAGYHAVIQARDENIVRAWLTREGYRWSSIYVTEPSRSKALRETPETLCYLKAEHVAPAPRAENPDDIQF